MWVSITWGSIKLEVMCSTWVILGGWQYGVGAMEITTISDITQKEMCEGHVHVI